MKNLLLLVVWLVAAAGCASAPDEAEAKARLLAASSELRERAMGTPAEFAANQRGWMEEGADALLNGAADPERRARIIEIYSRIYDDIQRGLNWKETRREIVVPRLAVPPRIDGIHASGEWHGAYRFDGEILLDTTRFVPDEPTRWRIGWHGDKLYAAAEFHDPSPEFYDCTLFDGPDRPMYLGDAFELFLRPSEASLLYYEFLVNPKGKLWCLAHVNDPRGSWLRVADDLKTGAVAAAVRTADGFSVELAVPLSELYGPGFRKRPQPGDPFTFMMVRTNRSGEIYTRSAPVPLLYEGHNVFGYIRARLGGGSAGE